MKKTELIAYRTDLPTKQALTALAAEKKWSLSQLTEEIVREWLRENRPDLVKTE